MNPERWKEIKRAFEDALARSASERDAFLAQLGDQDPELLSEVTSLLRSYEAKPEFLETPYADDAALETHAADSADWVGRVLGAYRVLELVGRGGMGAVYRAVRADGLYDRPVALKAIRSELSKEFFLRRFENERRILARLDHPNIARLLDGGASEEGVPYVVMEFVEGIPIDEYCERNELTIPDRLRLFRSVCAAVQYAHQNLIVHRDLKPANILVTADGEAKLLDFGIAKIRDPREDTGAGPALTMLPMMTPQFASPEQARGESVTTASDVYSLGVILYLLLTRQPPYRVASGSAIEVMRAICETQPVRPSTAVTWSVRGEAGSPAQAGQRPVSDRAARREQRRLRRALRGELDNIVLMALRKEPQRRYQSVERFSDDLRRYLEHLPVAATRDTLRYRSGKFLLRHRAGVAATALVILSLAVGLVLAWREARIAQRRSDDVAGLANSLIFDIHDAIRDLPGSTAARKLVVDKALQYLDRVQQESGGDDSLRRELADGYERVGAVQGQPFKANLGDTAGALRSYLKARAIRRSVAATDLAADRLSYARNCRTLAVLQLSSSNAAAALNTAREAVSVAQAVLKNAPESSEALAELSSAYGALAFILVESGAGAESGENVVAETYRKALEIDRRLAQGSTDRGRLRNLGVDEFHLGQNLRDSGHRGEALEAFERSLAIFERLRDTNDMQEQRDLLTLTTNMGDLQMMNGDPEQAAAAYQKTFAAVSALAALDPHDADATLMIGETQLNLGVALAKLGRAEEADSHLRQALAIFNDGIARDPQSQQVNWDLTVAYVWRASLSTDAREAGKDYEQALAIDERLAATDVGSDKWRENEAEVRVEMGNHLRDTHRPGAAAENYQSSLDAWRRIREPAAVSPSGFDSAEIRSLGKEPH
jgi:serine/threonine protein kinase